MKKLLFLLVLVITVVSCNEVPSRKSGYLGVESADSTSLTSQLFQVNLVLADSSIVDVYVYAIDTWDAQRLVELRANALPAYISYSVRRVVVQNKKFRYTPSKRVIE